MAQNLQPKQLNFVRQFSAAVVALLNANDDLTSLLANWNGNSYATTITDAVISGNSLIQDVAYISAAGLNEAEGAVVSVQAVIASNRGYLEMMRP